MKNDANNDPSGQPGRSEDANINGDQTSIGLSRKQILFNLDLNNIDRISNLLYIAGSAVMLDSTDEAEQDLCLQYTDQIGVLPDVAFNFDIAMKLVEANQLYILASLLSLYTSVERQKQIEAVFPQTESSDERKQGRELVTFGSALTVISFILTAQGYQIIADGTLKQERETFPPI